MAEQVTGHTGMLRERLKAARVARGMKQQDVADAIARRLGLESLGDTTISNWETMYRQPRVDEFAAWARAVGMRLIVDLEPADSTRMAVMVQRDRAELVKEIDTLDPEKLAIIRGMVKQLIK